MTSTQHDTLQGMTFCVESRNQATISRRDIHTTYGTEMEIFFKNNFENCFEIICFHFWLGRSQRKAKIATF